MKILIYIILIAIVALFAFNLYKTEAEDGLTRLETTIQIESKKLTSTAYSDLKSTLMNKYIQNGTFTPTEWQTYVAIINYEAKMGHLRNVAIKGDLHTSLMEKLR